MNKEIRNMICEIDNLEEKIKSYIKKVLCTIITENGDEEDEGCFSLPVNYEFETDNLTFCIESLYVGEKGDLYAVFEDSDSDNVIHFDTLSNYQEIYRFVVNKYRNCL